MQIFAQLSKVDEEKRLVYGIAAQEIADHSGEIMDYAKSKPNFASWSETMQKDSNGASMGNLRAMHGQVAAGKLTDIGFDDVEKSISVCAKVVDDNEWQKVLEGVYTGFSIGGKYGDKWQDGELKRYVAIPNEISLVDRPCMPTARFFDIQKSDGAMIKMEFKNQTEEVAVSGTPEDADRLAKLLSDSGLSISDAVIELQKAIAERKDTSAKEGEKKYGDVKFADEKNNKYPIDTAEHIRAAWNYINKPKNSAKYSAQDVKSIKGKIVAAWKDKIDKSGPPSAAKKSENPDGLEKSLYGVASLAQLIMSLQYLIQYGVADNDGDDDQPTIDKLNAVSETLAQIFIEYATEEAQELIGEGAEDDTDDNMEMFAAALDLMKAGARNSKSDKSHIQAMHDHATALGADCTAPAEKYAQNDDLQKADMQKAISEAVAPLQKRIAELEALPAPVAGVLMAIGKGEESQEVQKRAPVIDPITGQESEVASLIKASRGNMRVIY